MLFVVCDWRYAELAVGRLVFRAWSLGVLESRSLVVSERATP